MLKAFLSTQPSSFSAFMTHIVAQKPHRRQLNAKVCGSESAISILYFLFSDHFVNNDNSKTAQVLTLILAQN